MYMTKSIINLSKMYFNHALLQYNLFSGLFICTAGTDSVFHAFSTYHCQNRE